ncbi:MAG: ABC transporter ATP-binding protein [Janthinobacterium lividum]
MVIGRQVRRQRMLWTGVFGVIVSAALVAVAAQYSLKMLIDAMTASPPDREHVILRLGLFLGLLAVEACCWRLGGWLGSRAVIRLGLGVRLDLFEMAGSRPWSFLTEMASGAVGSRIRAGADSATDVARTLIWNLVPPSADLCGSVVVLALIDKRLAAALVVAVLLLTGSLHRAGLRGFERHQLHHREVARVAGDLMDTLTNMSLVHAHSALGRERDRLAGLLAVEGRAHARSWLFLEGLRSWHDAAFWLVTAGMMSAAVLVWNSGAISTGDVILVSTLSLRVLSGSRELALSALGVVNQFSAATEAVDALGASARPIAHTGGRCRIPGHVAGALELRNVRYQPDNGVAIFHDFNLSVPAGQRIGIVGPSGAGKSSLLRLLQGLGTLDAGEVLLDGEPLGGFSRDELAATFAVVTQDVQLLHRSIGENLWYGRPGASRQAMLAVSIATGCDRFIRALPQGYDTVVGEQGHRLSGGQRQRIAIARALLREAPVLLLDEATSALDSHAELEIQDALRTRLEGRTLLAVAHRLSTVIDFDRVIVLRDGVVIEDGPPWVLRDGPGWFAATLRLQQGSPQQAEEVT